MESELLKRDVRRRKRALSVGGRIAPGTIARPRLSYYQSNRYITAQLIDDENSRTLYAVSSQGKAFRQGAKTSLTGVDVARQLGKLLGQKAIADKIATIIVDRGHRRFHGALKALVDGAREVGIRV